MLKRVFFGLFAAMFLCGGAAAATDQAAIRAEVRSAVSAYAAAVDQPNAADEAFEDFLIQGFFVNSGRGDVNGDEMINIMDMAAFRQNFGLVGEPILNALTDINADGMVNIMDMATFRQNFGMTAERDCTTVYPL